MVGSNMLDVPMNYLKAAEAELLSLRNLLPCVPALFCHIYRYILLDN